MNAEITTSETLYTSGYVGIAAYDNDCRAVPYEELRRAYMSMPYACTEKVMFGLLFATGCRIKELDSMKKSNIQGGMIYWRVGKNQRGWRKAPLCKEYLDELETYRCHHKVRHDRLFGVSSETFTRYFHRYKALLCGGWIDKKVVPRGQGFGGYSNYALAGLRKSYQTLRCAQRILELGDRNMAVSAVSKEMRHSSEKITDYYYLQDLKSLNAFVWAHHTPWTILYGDGLQHCLSEYIHGG